MVDKKTVDSYVLNVGKGRNYLKGPTKYYYGIDFPTEDSKILNAHESSLELLVNLACVIADKDKAKTTTIVIKPSKNTFDHEFLSKRELSSLKDYFDKINMSNYQGRLKLAFQYPSYMAEPKQ